ncbi:alpha/beta hydrolase [Pengzhenrongella frigida]|uniref:Alpha/beta hydrolase n=1 Tax=Pengzhenrongella frigida TaxID=1259133 RepID=A0A4V1ZHB9_9MICO|nr:alpha/beta hydrolase [Cellulomonas sp. HLT2-17]RYV51504.1 alpha/beta hydrolase [Cellulomonas sp. HLT2-17]
MSRGLSASRLLVPSAVVGIVALVLAGCSAPKHQSSDGPATSSGNEEVVEPALQPFYDQTIEWSSCGDFECATAEVPTSYADPAAGSIELAVKRAPATAGDPMGSLLINPGGPGASGVDLVDSVVTSFGEDVLAQYDVVGFDPRGVAASNPVTCLDDAAKDALLSKDFDYATDAGIAEAAAAYAAMGAACEANTGALLGNVDTVSAAKDMDVLRAALGDEKLTYLGYSYGTALGATYAGLFPEKVGRMVLDGALDPALSSTELGLGQAIGFENALRAYVADCQGGSECPLTGTVDDGLTQIRDLLDRARRSPLPTGTDRALTSTLAFYGIAVTLYDNASWQFLTQALTAALDENDGSILLQLADFYNDRNADGSFASNSTEAFTAVNCLDGTSSADPAVMRAEAAQLEEAAPTVGYFFGYGGVICADWPYPSTGEPGPIAADGAPPIVVIGTTNDPATPYAWAENLAAELSSGVLLTYEGEGHTAYGRSNECILTAVDTYLLEGTAPADGTRC